MNTAISRSPVVLWIIAGEPLAVSIALYGLCAAFYGAFLGYVHAKGWKGQMILE
jgi:hypothetical protein